VLAARMGPSAVARMAAKERVKVIRSRFHRGQLRGSFGSSDGCGIYAPSKQTASCRIHLSTHENDGLLPAPVDFQSRVSIDVDLRTVGTVKVSRGS
jgi:hypothetical protein